MNPLQAVGHYERLPAGRQGKMNPTPPRACRGAGYSAKENKSLRRHLSQEAGGD